MRRPTLAFALLVLSTTSARADAVVPAAGCDPRYALVMGAALLGACALVRYVVAHFQRVRDARLATPVPVSLLVAERVARAVQRRAGAIATVGIVGVPALAVMQISSLAILSTIVGCVGLRSFFIARSMLRLIERAPRCASASRVVAGVLGQSVVVRSDDEEVSLDVSPRELAAARRHAVPTSIATRR